MWKTGAEDIRRFPIPLRALDVQRALMQQVQEMRAEVARERERAERLERESRDEIQGMIRGARAVILQHDSSYSVPTGDEK